MCVVLSTGGELGRGGAASEGFEGFVRVSEALEEGTDGNDDDDDYDEDEDNHDASGNKQRNSGGAVALSSSSSSSNANSSTSGGSNTARPVPPLRDTGSSVAFLASALKATSMQGGGGGSAAGQDSGSGGGGGSGFVGSGAGVFGGVVRDEGAAPAGLSLGLLLRRHLLSATHRAHAAVQVCRGLRALHGTTSSGGAAAGTTNANATIATSSLAAATAAAQNQASASSSSPSSAPVGGFVHGGLCARCVLVEHFSFLDPRDLLLSVADYWVGNGPQSHLLSSRSSSSSGPVTAPWSHATSAAAATGGTFSGGLREFEEGPLHLRAGDPRYLPPEVLSSPAWRLRRAKLEAAVAAEAATQALATELRAQRQSRAKIEAIARGGPGSGALVGAAKRDSVLLATADIVSSRDEDEERVEALRNAAAAATARSNATSAAAARAPRLVWTQAMDVWSAGLLIWEIFSEGGNGGSGGGGGVITEPSSSSSSPSSVAAFGLGVPGGGSGSGVGGPVPFGWASSAAAAERLVLSGDLPPRSVSGSGSIDQSSN